MKSLSCLAHIWIQSLVDDIKGSSDSEVNVEEPREASGTKHFNNTIRGYNILLTLKGTTFSSHLKGYRRVSPSLSKVERMSDGTFPDMANES